MKAMISQPMGGLTEKEIVKTRNRAIKRLESIATTDGVGYEIVNTVFTDDNTTVVAMYSRDNMIERGVVQIPLCFLAKSLENMSLCHVAYFAKGWENARGCKVEHEAVKAYGLTIIYEEGNK